MQVLVSGVPIHNGISVNHVNKKTASGEETCENIVITSRKQYGLPNDAVIYCNFNQLYKVDPLVMETWVNILKMVPNSVLWLLSFPAAGEPNVQKYAQSLGNFYFNDACVQKYFLFQYSFSKFFETMFYFFDTFYSIISKYFEV